MLLYRNILKGAIKNTWRHKYLWFFGLFAALLGNGGEYEILIRGLTGDSQQSFFPGLKTIAATGVFSIKTLSNIGQLFIKEPFTIIMMLLVGLIILILFGFLVWLTIVSQAGLVNNAALIIGNKKNNFQDGINAGIRNFWPVFGLNIIIKIVVFLVFLLISLPLILTATRVGWQVVSLTYGIFFIIFIPIAIALSFIIKYAIAYVVIKGVNFIEAIKSGWQLFIKNWLVSLEMAIILFLINLAIGLILVLVFLILAVPFTFLAMLFYKFASLLGFWMVIVFAIFLFFAAIVLVGSVLSTFQISAWTGLFIELVGKGGVSKINRIMGKITHS